MTIRIQTRQTETAGDPVPDTDWTITADTGAIPAETLTVSDIGEPITHGPLQIVLTAQDSDPTSVVTINVVTEPAHGVYIGNLYTPISGYSGPDAFTYQATNDKGLSSNIGHISIFVTSPPPTAPTNVISALVKPSSQYPYLDQVAMFRGVPLVSTDATYSFNADAWFAGGGQEVPAERGFAVDSFAQLQAKIGSEVGKEQIAVFDLEGPHTDPVGEANSFTDLAHQHGMKSAITIGGPIFTSSNIQAIISHGADFLILQCEGHQKNNHTAQSVVNFINSLVPAVKAGKQTNPKCKFLIELAVTSDVSFGSVSGPNPDSFSLTGPFGVETIYQAVASEVDGIHMWWGHGSSQTLTAANAALSKQQWIDFHKWFVSNYRH